MDADFWGLFESIDWTYGHDRDRRVLGTKMSVRLARADGSRSEILVDIDRSVFQRSKETILAATAEWWPAENAATRLHDFMRIKLDECLAITGYGDVHVEFAGIEGFRLLYDEWDEVADADAEDDALPGRRFIAYHGDPLPFEVHGDGD